MSAARRHAKAGLALLGILFLSSTTWAQRRPRLWNPQSLDWYYYKVPAWPGFAVMSDGDTVKGLIKILALTSTFPLMDTTTKKVRYLGYPFVV